MITGTIFDNGNLGIGTTSPGAKLDVVGSIWANGSRPIKLNPAGSITIQAGPGGWADYLHFLGSSGTDRGGFGAAGSDDNLTYLYAGDSYSNPTMVWKGGNVGIGTPNPATRLDVNGDSIFRGTLTINRENGQLKLSGGTYNGGLWTDGHILRLDNWNTSVGALAVNLANGNVGIGTPSPAYKLDVNGNARITGNMKLGTDGVDYFIYGPKKSGTQRGSFIKLIGTDPLNPHLEMGVIDYSSGGIFAPFSIQMDKVGIRNNNPSYALDVNSDMISRYTLYYNYISHISDGRLKQNQVPLNYGLQTILALQPKRFDVYKWFNNPENGEIEIEDAEPKNDIGLIAQEVHQFIPEAVTVPQDPSKEPWGISYDKIVSVMIKAMQEQQQQIQSQQEQIEDLRQQIKDLRQEIEALKAKF